MHASTRIETYRGRTIFLDDGEEGSGFFWRDGNQGQGYFETLEDCRESIDDDAAEWLEIDRREGRVPPGALETALPSPWWEAR